MSSTVPDWSREDLQVFWDPARQLLRTLREYGACRERSGRVAGLRRRWIVLRHRFWSVVTGADIPLNCRLGGGLLLPHPNGIVIHPEAEIGVNCLILQQVTIGIGEAGAPRLAGHVDVGAGARILGGVTIGAHARIGANAVVLRDVPAHATAVGIPARVLGKDHQAGT